MKITLNQISNNPNQWFKSIDTSKNECYILWIYDTFTNCVIKLAPTRNFNHVMRESFSPNEIKQLETYGEFELLALSLDELTSILVNFTL